MGWNSTLTRKTPLRAKKPWRPARKSIERKTVLTAKKPMKRAGKKTKAWDACRASLKTRFKRAGITTCEIGYPGCWKDNALSFAHSKKRRNIAPGELEEVCLACTPCHDIIEGWPEEAMTAFVRGIIAGRGIPV